MASVITATTTSGLTQSADNSGVLQLASGTGNLVTVPSVTGTAMVSGNMPAFAVWGSSGTSLTNNINTKITYDTEEFDTNNNFASSRFTPTVAGYYQLNANLLLVSSSSGILGITVYKNGSLFKNGSQIVNSGDYIGANISVLVYANGTTDYFEIYSLQNNGTTRTTLGGQAYNWFQGSLVRTA